MKQTKRSIVGILLIATFALGCPLAAGSVVIAKIWPCSKYGLGYEQRVMHGWCPSNVSASSP